MGGRKGKSRIPTVKHSTVVLDVDIDQAVIRGYVEMQFKSKYVPNQSLLLHARQISIEKVLFNNVETDYQYVDYLTSPCDPKESSRSVKYFNIFHKASYESEDKGELSINIPLQFQNATSFSVRVYYNLEKPTAGIHFSNIRPSEVTIHDEHGLSAKERLAPPHMYSHNEVESARCWMPCMDRFSQPCTWSFQYRTLSCYTVVSSGELIGTESEETDDMSDDPRSLTTYYYELKKPTSAKSIAISAGIFEIYPDAVLPNVTYFCLPGKMPMLKHTTKFLHKAFLFYEQYLQSKFPYPSLKIVFVEHGYTKMSSFSGLAIMSGHLLHDEKIIDKTLKARWLLSLAVAIQWFGCAIGIKSWSDMWLRFGLPAHIANLYFRELFGNNEHRLRRYKNFVDVGKLDDGHRPPLYWCHPLHPIQYYQPLLLKKAPIVLDMLERRLSPEIFQKILVTLVNPESKGKVSTRIFIELLKQEAAAPEIKHFERQWIAGKGCPQLLTGFLYNKKRQQTEFVVKQTLPPQDRFSGTLIIRINELDGTYDNTIEFADEIQGEDFHCQSRLRKNRKKKIQYVNGEEVEVDLSQQENPLLWIRVDPDCNWGPLVQFLQPEYMWIYQIEMDRDVIGQYQAIRALSNIPTTAASNALSRVIADPKYFYGIRVEAAKALAICANKETEWISMDKLLQFFQDQYYDKKLKLVRPNDFDDFAAYHLKKAVIAALSVIKNKEGYTPIEVLEFLLDLLKNNENSTNEYSDYKYVATIILSLANTNTSTTKDCNKILKQIHRYLKLEKLVPSYQRTITSACLKCFTEMQLQEKLDKDLTLFISYSRYDHHESVRAVSFKSIIILSVPSDEKSLNMLMNLLEDPLESPRLKYKVLAGWIQFIEEERYDIKPLQEQNTENMMLCEFLWKYLNSIHTAFDSRLRWITLELYKSIWGSERPSCLPVGEEPVLNLGVSSNAIDTPAETENTNTNIAISTTSIKFAEPKKKKKPKSFKATFRDDTNILHIDLFNRPKLLQIMKEVEEELAKEVKEEPIPKIVLSLSSSMTPTAKTTKKKAKSSTPRKSRKSKANIKLPGISRNVSKLSSKVEEDYIVKISLE